MVLLNFRDLLFCNLKSITLYPKKPIQTSQWFDVFHVLHLKDDLVLNLHILFMLLLVSMMTMMNCFCGMVDRQKEFSFIPAGTIARDPHYRESPTFREQDLNLRRTWIQV